MIKINNDSSKHKTKTSDIRIFSRFSMIIKSTTASVKMISFIVWLSAIIGNGLAESEAGINPLRFSSFSTSTDFVNPFKSRGASLRGRNPIEGENHLRDAAPFPFRHVPNPVVLRPVPDSFFYDTHLSPQPVHLRRQRQQFQNAVREREPILSTPFVKSPNNNPIVQIKELPPRNLNPHIFPNTLGQSFSRRGHSLLAASLDSTVVKLQEISQLPPQTSPFPPPLTPPPPPEAHVVKASQPSQDAVITGTAVSFASFTQGGKNMFNHRIRPTVISNRDTSPLKTSSEMISHQINFPSSFMAASKKHNENVHSTTRSRLGSNRGINEASDDPSFFEPVTQRSIRPIMTTEPFTATLSTSPGSAFATVRLRSGLGVRVTERPPGFTDFSNKPARNRGSTADTIAKLRQQHIQIKLTPTLPAVPPSTPALVTNRARDPRIFSSATNPVKTTTSRQESSTSFSTPTTSLFLHVREGPFTSHNQKFSSGTTKSLDIQPPETHKTTSRQSFLNAIAERQR